MLFEVTVSPSITGIILGSNPINGIFKVSSLVVLNVKSPSKLLAFPFVAN